MARRSKGPLPPRTCAPDLPVHLDDVTTLNPGDDLADARIAGLVGEVDAQHGRLDACVIEDASVDRIDLCGATLTDVRLSGVRATTLAARDGRWRNVLFTGGRIGTLDLLRAELDGVELRGLRIDYVSLASASVDDVRFVDCVIGAIDLPDARAERVAFEDCRADEVDTRGLRATEVDLRGLDALSFADPAGLRGATMTELQAAQHAASFAAALGVRLY
ncbi:MAG: hypothetical protein QM708_05315 [Propioniciclava sp.]|uniref:pentapeptide repeat-containing protein n=1 Tax=Propioniciclava sp. TaxID=2038686 RepID=UPI0039E43415